MPKSVSEGFKSVFGWCILYTADMANVELLLYIFINITSIQYIQFNYKIVFVPFLETFAPQDFAYDLSLPKLNLSFNSNSSHKMSDFIIKHNTSHSIYCVEADGATE